MLHRIVVVGASLAGLRAVETLRDRGFDGALTLIGEEPHRPYDRPPLSKQVLQGTASRSTTASSATAPVRPRHTSMRPATWPGSQTAGTAIRRESSIGPTRSSKRCMPRRTRSPTDG